ncbi:MAG: DUF2339 domain-containing protein [Rhodococcus sp. (in: high G+C Gram-positive bacteria)]
MTSDIDPRLVHVLSGEVASLQQHLLRVGHDLDILRSQLLSSQKPVPARLPLPHRPSPQGPPLPRPEPTPPWWQRDGVVSRLLAAAGAAVTVIGVVMLVVLAAQSGWFGPGARVAAGAVLSGALVAAAHRIVDRPGGRTGAVASAAAGFAAAYLDIAAVTSLYVWVHPVVGLALGLGTASIGIAVATRWQSQALAVMVVVGIAVLAPVVTDVLSPLLTAFLVVLQIAAAPIDARFHWVWLRIAAAAPVIAAVLGSALLAYNYGASDADLTGLLAAAAVSFAVAVTSWHSTLSYRQVDPVSLSVLAGTAGGVLATASLFSGPIAGGIAAAVAAALIAILVNKRELDTTVRVVLAVMASVAGAAAVLQGTPESVHATTLLVVAAAALLTGGRMRSVSATTAGVLFAALGMGTHTRITSVDAVSSLQGALVPGWASVPASIAALAMAAAGVWAVGRTVDDPTLRVLGTAVFGVGGLSAIVALTVVVGTETGGRTGFLLGHGAATVLWVVVAAAALARGLTDDSNARALLAAGLAVISAAVAKLFVFDLGTLGGLPRAAAFLVVGVMLLVIGTRYARVFADRLDAGVSPDADEPAARSH